MCLICLFYAQIFNKASAEKLSTFRKQTLHIHHILYIIIMHSDDQTSKVKEQKAKLILGT